MLCQAAGLRAARAASSCRPARPPLPHPLSQAPPLPRCQVFVHDGEQNIPIDSMPGVARLGWRHGLLDAVAEARSYGVNQVVIFPKVRQRCDGVCKCVGVV